MKPGLEMPRSSERANPRTRANTNNKARRKNGRTALLGPRPDIAGKAHKHLRNSGRVNFDAINRTPPAAFPAVAARIARGGKHAGTEPVARKPHQHQPRADSLPTDRIRRPMA
jgi:hypothetical protein